MLSARPLAAIAVLCSALVLACGGGENAEAPSATATATTQPAATSPPEATAVESRGATPGLKPADSEQPAAGICAGPTSGPVVTIELLEGIPDPRCSYLTPEQTIRFVNRLKEPVTLTVGRYSGTVGPNSILLFDAPAGSYLALGVHAVDASVPSARAELWLREGQ